MEDLLISTIEELFGFPVILQGSMSPEERYPDHFFTYWNNSADGTAFYSNNEGAIVWDYTLNFYSKDPQAVNTKLMEAKAGLKAVGFIVNGAGHSVVSDEPTHTGRGIEIKFRQEQ